MSTSSFALVGVADDQTRHAAEKLLREYLLWINDTASQNYALSFDIEAMIVSDLNDPGKFYPPTGRYYLLQHDDEFVGVGCLKRLEPAIAEILRMYVTPKLRGRGAGRVLANQLLNDARSIGYRKVRLESLQTLKAAHALYRSLGFTDIRPYRSNSMQNYQPAETLETYNSSAVFMELDLE
jgi:GNAT superfamily N-acetyltransferase